MHLQDVAAAWLRLREGEPGGLQPPANLGPIPPQGLLVVLSSAAEAVPAVCGTR